MEERPHGTGLARRQSTCENIVQELNGVGAVQA